MRLTAYGTPCSSNRVVGYRRVRQPVSPTVISVTSLRGGHERVVDRSSSTCELRRCDGICEGESTDSSYPAFQYLFVGYSHIEVSQAEDV